MDRIDELIIRSLQGRATPEEQAELDAWRRSSPEHERIHEELTALWGLTGFLETSAPSNQPPPVRDVLERVGAEGPGRRGWWRHGAAAAAAAMALVAAAGLLSRRASVTRFGPAQYVNSDDQIDSLRLPDNTLVHLGPNARLRTAGGSGRREVWLQGAAQFAVAEEPGAPFTVNTGAGLIEVRGTRFVVRAEPGSTHLLVLNGRVWAWSGADTVVVAPGQVSLLVQGARPAVRTLGRTQSPDDWLRAALVFEATPLEEVAAALGRRYRLQVIVADTTLRKRTFSALFRTEPSVQQVVNGVCRAVAVRCSMSDTAAIIGVK